MCELAFHQTLCAGVTSSGSSHLSDLRGFHEFFRDLGSQIRSIVNMHARGGAVTGKPFSKQQARGGNCIVLVVTAGYGLGEIGEVIDYDHDPRSTVVGGAEFHVVVLDRLVEVSGLYVFEMKTNVSRLIANLLTSETLTYVFANSTTNSWLAVAFLYACQNLANALMTHSIVCTKENSVLIQLGLYNQAGSLVKQAL